MRTLLTAVLALTLGACASAAPSGSAPPAGSGGGGGGAGEGSGGSGGEGGSGGTGGMPRMVQLSDSLEPSSGPPGTEVIFKGQNLDLVSAAGFAGATADILDIDPPGTFLRTVVPEGASTGNVYVEVGQLRVEGPKFNVEVRPQVPAITSLDPTVFVLGQPPRPLTVYGLNLSSGTVFVDGVAQPTSEVTGGLVATLGAALIATAGTHTVTVSTPLGGTSASASFEVDAALRLVGAGFSDARTLVLRFDRPLGPLPAADSEGAVAVSIDPALGLAYPEAPATSPRMLTVSVSGPVPDATFTLSVSGGLRGADGSRLIPGSVSFRSWTALPELLDTRSLPQDCTARGLLDPSGMTAAGDQLLVTERMGNQVQALTLQGVPTVFYGSAGDGTIPGPFSQGTAAGCPGQEPEADGGLLLPVGAAIGQSDGGVLVANTSKSTLLLYGAKGGLTSYSWVQADNVSPVLKRPVLLLSTDTDAYVATVDGLWSAPLTGHGLPRLIAGLGTSDLQFGFDVAGGGIPAASWGPDPHAASLVAYFVEPGNHRIQRLDNFVLAVQAGGWVGAGHEGTGFKTGGSCCTAGTAPGQFTRPHGLAVLPGGAILVIDEANGGRLQKLAPSGVPLASEDLGYMPMGIALASNGMLFIVEDGALHRYVP